MCAPPEKLTIFHEKFTNLPTKIDGEAAVLYLRPRVGLPMAELVQMAEDIASAFAYLHPRVVHRDLKPTNILLDADGRAKVRGGAPVGYNKQIHR